mgnify:FL=1
MISHLGFMPGGNALKSHLTEAGFALDSVHDDFEVWARGSVRVHLEIADPCNVASDLLIELQAVQGGIAHAIGSKAGVRPIDAIDELDALVRQHYTPLLALLAPGPPPSPGAIAPEAFEPMMWRREDALLVRLVVPTDGWRALGTLAARVLRCSPKDVLVEYGPKRAAACAEVGVADPNGTLLFVKSSRVER